MNAETIDNDVESTDTLCCGNGCPRADLCRRYMDGPNKPVDAPYFSTPPLRADGSCDAFVSNGWVRKDPSRCAGAHPPPRCNWNCAIVDGDGLIERHFPRDQRQGMIADWAKKAFGEVEATSLPQRGLRLLEEAIEAFQACGGDEEIAHKLVAFVFARPKGTVAQELGGVAVTTLALAAAAGLSADEEERREVHRVLSKPPREFTERNASKNAAGFKIEAPRRNPCCGNVGTCGEDGREYCATCGQEVLP